MGEQLAVDLQARYGEEHAPHAPRAHTHSVSRPNDAEYEDEPCDADADELARREEEELQLALSLSAAEHPDDGLEAKQAAAVTAAAEEDEEAATDLDYVIAMQLQQQLEDQDLEQHRRAKQSDFSKVSYYSSGPLDRHPLSPHAVYELYSDDEDEEEGEDEVDLDEEIARDLEEEEEEMMAEERRVRNLEIQVTLQQTQAARASTLKKPHHQVAKPQGRQPRQGEARPSPVRETAAAAEGEEEEEYEEEEGEVTVAIHNRLTKHDPIRASLKNARQLQHMACAGDMRGVRISTEVYNAFREQARRQMAHATRVRGNRVDNSTHEQVLDHRTRVTLLAMLNSGVLAELGGIVSTGKESNVYFARAEEEWAQEQTSASTDVAIKIFKTSLNEFRNRTEYVQGEFRFRHRPPTPRKLIKLWAEKELRNLKRLRKGGVPCPHGLLQKDNLLIMGFLGEDGLAAPSLKDVDWSEKKLESAYIQTLGVIHRMYHECRLVHADLSEYNLLWHRGQVHVIDVSQAVEYDHPRSTEYLRRDCAALEQFFVRAGVRHPLSMRQMFDSVTEPEHSLEEFLARVKHLRQENASNRVVTNEEQVEDGVFRKSFIPRFLSQVDSPFSQQYIADTGFHRAVTGLQAISEASQAAEPSNE
jgi:serine/threonine-protein kinase RIO1